MRRRFNHQQPQFSMIASSISTDPNDPIPCQKWYQYFSPTDTPEERRLVLKIDALIMIFVFLAYWAKVSGMKEDLGLYGNELNYLNTVYMVGFIVMQVPLTMLMTRFPVDYFLPAADLLWGVFTLVQYKVSSVHQLYAFRFFVGRIELNRRGALFFIASQVGSMSSGYIQAGAYDSLNGKHGIEGWRFLFLPGTPTKPNSRFFTSEDIALARARMISERREPTRPLNLDVIKQVLRGWHFWILVIFAFFFSQADTTGHLVECINTVTTVSPAVTIISSVIWDIIADAYDAKVFLTALTAGLDIFASVMLAIWDVPVGLKYFAFFLGGTADAITAIIYAWANEICAGEERALITRSMNTAGNTFGAWLPVWKTVDAPRYLIGYNWTIALDVCMLGMLFVLRHFWNREKNLAAVSI
ncbi:pantothenate transporter [Acephala macrosclerotiorum]|nr:pantothenate transporter [Acephala macrosclerotiorum]